MKKLAIEGRHLHAAIGHNFLFLKTVLQMGIYVRLNITCAV